MIRDRAYIEEMKADILRRAEAFSDEEDEDEQHALNTMDDLDDSVPVVASAVRDGEQSGDEEEEGEAKESPQIILELAYLRDPELLDRKSRGTKGRLDLKGQTKMADEQIEGWKSMLERDVSNLLPELDEPLMNGATAQTKGRSPSEARVCWK